MRPSPMMWPQPTAPASDKRTPLQTLAARDQREDHMIERFLADLRQAINERMNEKVDET